MHSKYRIFGWAQLADDKSTIFHVLSTPNISLFHAMCRRNGCDGTHAIELLQGEPTPSDEGGYMGT